LDVTNPGNPSRDTGCISETSPPITCQFKSFSAAYTLLSSDNDGPHTVYARYKTSGGTIAKWRIGKPVWRQWVHLRAYVKYGHHNSV